MLVKIHKDGRNGTGLHIGEANARRYFSRRRPYIELRLDDLRIRCTLPPDFWQGRPEIHDPRLSGWLEFKVGRCSAGRDSLLLSMVPSGSDTFVVRPHSARQPESLAADITHPRVVQSEHALNYDAAPSLDSCSVA
jgi:hypothetical protein